MSIYINKNKALNVLLSAKLENGWINSQKIWKIPENVAITLIFCV